MQIHHIEIKCLVQDCGNSSTLVMELLQSCDNQMIWIQHEKLLSPSVN